MWLDRFAGHSGAPGTTSPLHRQASPVRRSSQLNANAQPSRPPFNARSSSLSLTSVANASTNSLPGTLRQANGSALRSKTPNGANVNDPLETLQGIIGRKENLEELKTNAKILEKPERLVDTIDFADLSLEDFAKRNDERPKLSNILQASQPVEQRGSLNTDRAQ